ncbi:MAG: AAA family ATPase [Parcubacteria group bacterium]|jgi:CYTH domain-containing protein/thymidylate kinase
MLTGKILLIVLTGGPCAGKTSALCRLLEWLTGLDYRVAIVPEAATELITCGIRPQNFDDNVLFQQFVTKNICAKEDLFAMAALRMKTNDPSKPTILLCDRGLMDSRAYVGDEAFTKILAKENLDLADACDRRYAGVIHLRTAADGAEEYYTLSNNAARSESPKKARELDQATEQAWHGHHRLVVVDNSTSFAGKLMRTQQIVSSILGIPGPTEYERKFLITEADEPLIIPIPHVDVAIEQYYLNGDKERVRKRTRHDASTYFYTIKTNRPGMERAKVDRIISEDEFFDFLRRRDLSRGVVRKTRTHFVWQNQYFELDHFHHNNMKILEVRLTQGQTEVILPPFIPTSLDVTDDERFYNNSIAASIKD